jgi:hypothetical protein
MFTDLLTISYLKGQGRSIAIEKFSSPPNPFKRPKLSKPSYPNAGRIINYRSKKSQRQIESGLSTLVEFVNIIGYNNGEWGGLIWLGQQD